MKRTISIVLVLAFVAGLFVSFGFVPNATKVSATATVADGRWESETEYVDLGTDTFRYGEYIRVAWKLDAEEANRYLVIYTDADGDGAIDEGTDVPYGDIKATDNVARAEVVYDNFLLIRNGGWSTYYVGRLDAGSYIVTFRYNAQKPWYNDRYDDYTTGDKSDILLPFTVTEDADFANTTPSITAPSSVRQGEQLIVNYSNVTTNQIFVQQNDTSGNRARIRMTKLSVYVYNSENQLVKQSVILDPADILNYMCERTGSVKFDTSDLSVGTYTLCVHAYKGMYNRSDGSLHYYEEYNYSTITVQIKQPATIASGRWESGNEYVDLGTDTFRYGEYIRIAWKLDTEEANRYMVIYTDADGDGVIDEDTDLPYGDIKAVDNVARAEVVYDNFLLIRNGGWSTYYVGRLDAGSYIVTFRYNANKPYKNDLYADYKAGEKSDVLVPFTVTEDADFANTKPSITAPQTVINGDKLVVNYANVTTNQIFVQQNDTSGNRARIRTTKLSVYVYNSENQLVKQVVILDPTDILSYTCERTGKVELDTSDLPGGTYTLCVHAYKGMYERSDGSLHYYEEYDYSAITVTVKKQNASNNGRWENGTEYVDIGSNTFSYKDFIWFSFKFDEDESGRMLVLYNDVNGNGVADSGDTFCGYASAGSNTAKNITTYHTFGKAQASGNWTSGTLRELPVGDYVLKVMYLPSGAYDNLVDSYQEGSKSDAEIAFTVETATTDVTPSVSVSNTTVLEGDSLEVAFKDVTAKVMIGEWSGFPDVARLTVSLYNAAGEKVLSSVILDTSAGIYAGKSGSIFLNTKGLVAGTYTVKLDYYRAFIKAATGLPEEEYPGVYGDTYTITVKGAQLSAQPELKESITMHYTVELGSSITGTPVMKYVYNDKEIIVDGTLVGDNAYMFALEGILPQDMGKTIDAYVTIDGTEITRYEGYSVRQYCLNQLAKTDDANLKALLVALLNYGTQAQGYFGSADAAINDGLDQSLLTDYLAGKGYDASNPAGNVAAPVNGSNDGDYVWKAATLGLYDTIKIRVKFQATSVEGLKVVAGGQEYTEFVSAGTNLWYVYIPVYAADFAEPLTITFQDSTGIVGATLTYSVNTYIKYAMDNGSAEVKPLVEAIYYYGVLASERA